MHRSLESFVGGLTIAELAGRSGKTVEDLVGWAMSAKTGPASKQVSKGSAKKKSVVAATGAPSKAVKPAKKADKQSVNTRTSEGRAAFDTAVVDALIGVGKPVGATPLIKMVGGTALQMRTALARLVDERKATQTGRARATVYAAR